MKTAIALKRCSSYDSAAVAAAVGDAVAQLGGVEAFVRPGSSVLVKPNLLLAAAPEKAIDTHPEVVRAVIRLLRAIKCTVYVGDSPSVWGTDAPAVQRVYEESGVAAVCRQEGVELVYFDKRRWRHKFPLTTWLDRCEFLVNVPKFKTHTLTTLTGGVKNCYGLVCGNFKTELHKNYFDLEEFGSILVDIYREAAPALTVIDGIMGMEGDGPATAGTPRRVGVIMAGKDCVALDAAMAAVMGIDPLSVVSTRVAAARGAGEARLAQVSIKGDRLEACIVKNFRPPTTAWSRKLPPGFVRAVKRFFRHLPVLAGRRCVRCGVCITACPHDAIRTGEHSVHFDYKKCLSCFCCQESCPQGAIRVKRSLLAKLAGI